MHAEVCGSGAVATEGELLFGSVEGGEGEVGGWVGVWEGGYVSVTSVTAEVGEEMGMSCTGPLSKSRGTSE
jgi:hypothetical protein